MFRQRKTKATIHLDNIKHNLQFANRLAPNSNNMAIIKANAYGHGLVQVAKHLENYVPAFGVAIVEEAVALRESGIKKPILVLQGTLDMEALEYANKNDICLMLHEHRQLDLIEQANLANKQKVWLKIDTGMHRLGILPEHINNIVERVLQCEAIDENFVLTTHFSSASNLSCGETALQMERFDAVAVAVNAMASAMKHQPSTIDRSIANSPGLVGHSDARLEWNRPGIMLYGMELFDQSHSSDEHLRAGMTFSTEVIGLREIDVGESVGYNQQWTAKRRSKIATLAVGYADGYPRHAPNGTPVYISGHTVPLVGCVSMDMISVDVTDVAEVSIGTVAELWGKNISANKVATCSNTIGYDLLTGISDRVPRAYEV